MFKSRDAVWTVAASLLSAGCQLALLAVAARYLDAHAFGAMAIVNVMMVMVSGFQDMGLSSYCVHLGEVSRRSQSTLFWISVALGGVGAGGVLLSAWPLAWFYDIPDLNFLLPLLSLNFLIVGLSGQYQANFVRVFKARLLAQIELLTRIVSFSLTLVLLMRFHLGTTALVIGLEIFWLVRLLLMVAFAPSSWHPRLQFDRQLARSAVAYGAYQSGGLIVSQLRFQADQLILGKTLGPEALGLYSIAKELVGYPLRVVQPLVGRFTLPLLAHHQNDRTALQQAFLTSLRRSAQLGALLFAPFALLAPWIVEVLYGPRFAAATSLLPLMALFGTLRLMNMSAFMLAEATGRAAIEFRWHVLSLALVLPLNLAFAAWLPSLQAFALGLSLSQLLLSGLLYPCFIAPLEPVGWRTFLRTWQSPTLIVLAASGLALSGLIHLPSLRALLRAAWPV